MIASAFAVTLVLLLILLTNEGARVLSRAADNQYPHDVVFALIGLGALQHLPILVPIGLLLGMVMAFGRLYHDSEMTAALACGVGMARIYAPVISVGIVVAAVLAWLSLSVGPASMARVLALRSEAVHAGQLAPVAPGRFRVLAAAAPWSMPRTRCRMARSAMSSSKRDRGGDRKWRSPNGRGMRWPPTARISPSRCMTGSGSKGCPAARSSASSRNLPQLVDSGAPAAAARCGRGPGRRPDARADRGVRARPPGAAAVAYRIAGHVPGAGGAGRAASAACAPRRGRLSRVWLAVLLFILYFQLLSAGRVAIEHGTLPATAGLWWTHVVVVVTVLLITQLPAWLARRAQPDRAGPRVSPA